MTWLHQTISILITLFLMIVVINLVRKRQLREEYSWLWLITGSGLLILSLSSYILKSISNLLQMTSSNVLFMLAIVFLVAVVLQFSIRLSELTNKVRKLAQESALQSTELRKKCEHNIHNNPLNKE